MSSDMNNQLLLARKEAKMYREMYERACAKMESLERRLGQEEYINRRYRQWFTYHRTWVAQHNRLIKYNPNYGRSMLRCGNQPDSENMPPMSDKQILDDMDKSHELLM